MEPVFTDNKDGLQLALRVQNNNAFLFGINYCRHNLTSEKKNVQFNIQVLNEKLQFPSKPINIVDSSFFMWPVNFTMQNILLKYATAQPLCTIGNKWIFIQDAASNPEFCFDSSNIQMVSAGNGKVHQKDGRYIVSNLKPGTDCAITVRDKNNNEKKIIILSKEEAKHAWLLNEGNKKYFFVTQSGMYLNKGKLHVFDTAAIFRLEMLDENNAGIFKSKSYTVPEKKFSINYKESFLLDKAQWLQTGVKELNEKNQLWHRFFLKDFSLNNPAYLKTATLFIAPQSYCRLQVNNSWVNQEIKTDAINHIDLTGYLQKGENRLLIDFPFEVGQKAFAAKLQVEFANADRFEIYSDSSWLTKDSYTFPSYLSKAGGGYKQPDTLLIKNVLGKKVDGIAAYSISLAGNYLEGVKNLYLKIGYTGDKARIYFNHRLKGDDFNNGSTWTIGVNNFNNNLHTGKLQLEIVPLSVNTNVYFDDTKAKRESDKAMLQNLRLVPVYETTIEIRDIQ